MGTETEKILNKAWKKIVINSFYGLNVPNLNGRIYPQGLMERELERYRQEIEKKEKIELRNKKLKRILKDEKYEQKRNQSWNKCNTN